MQSNELNERNFWCNFAEPETATHKYPYLSSRSHNVNVKQLLDIRASHTCNWSRDSAK